MLIGWIHWLSSLHPEELWPLVGGLLLLDAPRYALSTLLMCVWDTLRALFPGSRSDKVDWSEPYMPSVCVVLAGYNEAKTIAATLGSLWGTYPNLQIIVVDDGSQDGMRGVAEQFAASHAGVLVLGRSRRNGKSSALNTAIPYTNAEVIVTVDTDSHLAPGALWEIVQPLKDPQVGAVSATVRARNAATNLVTWLQAYEYLQTIFLGRMVASRLGMLGIVSGAFGAFRRSALERVGGWDVGPGEDGDLTLRLRKIGYKIAFAPYAQCHSNVPTAWLRLFHQRRRWDRGVITFECRKHLDMAYFWRPGFRLSDCCMLVERWFFNILCLYGTWLYLVWLLLASYLPGASVAIQPLQIGVSLYVCYFLCELIGVLGVLSYSNLPWQDLRTCLIFPLVPMYQLFLKAASLVAVTEEILWRSSFEDNFVPEHVRKVTWHW